MPTAAKSARERVRDELIGEITDVARTHLAGQGSAGLSLRAIARDLGMVSSAIYRYFPSRDDLLTALIVDAYTAVGTAAAEAEAAVPRDDPLSRWLAVTHGTRAWALAHPQEYALIFGSPIPGYQAPQDTIDPAARIPFLLLHIIADAHPPVDDAEIPASIAQDVATLLSQLPPDLQTLSETVLVRALAAWTMLIGSISFELFGHLNNVIHDYETYFDHQMRSVAAGLGLPGA